MVNIEYITYGHALDAVTCIFFSHRLSDILLLYAKFILTREYVKADIKVKLKYLKKNMEKVSV